ncbi:Protein VAC14 homolog [Linum perenne]
MYIHSNQTKLSIIFHFRRARNLSSLPISCSISSFQTYYSDSVNGASISFHRQEDTKVEARAGVRGRRRKDFEVLLLKSVDYGRMAEILVQRAGSSDEFTWLTAITWVNALTLYSMSIINEFVKLAGDQLVPYYAIFLAQFCPVYRTKRRRLECQLSSESEATQIEALHWISALLNRHRDDVLNFLDDIFDSLLKALSDPSDQVVLLVLEVHACIAEEPQHFRQLVVFLMHNFHIDISLLEKCGGLTIRRVYVLLDAEKVYRELSKILEGEADLDFASMMVQVCSSQLQFSTALALNLILLTSSELAELRDLLKQSLVNAAGKDLFQSLYASWCHSPVAIISLCFLVHAINLSLFQIIFTHQFKRLIDLDL